MIVTYWEDNLTSVNHQITTYGSNSGGHWNQQSFSERRSYERRSERALMTDERERERNHFPSTWARAGAHWKTDERERKLALIFCAHQSPYFY